MEISSRQKKSNSDPALNEISRPKQFYFTYEVPGESTPQGQRVNSIEQRTIQDDQSLKEALNSAYQGTDESKLIIKFIIHESPPFEALQPQDFMNHDFYEKQ